MGFFGWLTGSDSPRQKRNYNAAVDRYHNYAAEAQRTVDSMTQSLQQSLQSLQGLEQQKYFSELRAGQLRGQVGEYETALSRLTQRQASATSDAESLKAAVEGFKSQVPAMEGRISELETMPSSVQRLFELVSAQKERLRGLSAEEAGREITNYKQEVERLKQERAQTEQRMQAAMADITSRHQSLTGEKTALEGKLESYKLKQEQLLQESSGFAEQKNALQRVIGEYNQQQEQLGQQYTSHKANAEQQEKQLQDYLTASQQQLDALGGDVGFSAGKYKQGARLTGLVQGLALAGVGIGAGNMLKLGGKMLGGGLGGTLGSVASGVKAMGLLGGLSHYLSAANAGNRLGNTERLTLEQAAGSGNLAGLAGRGLSSPRQAIPELGNLQQALQHFNLPSVPKLKDLPQLREALGKITSLQDIEGLTLGLPAMTSASGKKYSAAVLYNPDFIKKLRKLSYGIAMPYLRGGAHA